MDINTDGLSNESDWQNVRNSLNFFFKKKHLQNDNRNIIFTLINLWNQAEVQLFVVSLIDSSITFSYANKKCKKTKKLI